VYSSVHTQYAAVVGVGGTQLPWRASQKTPTDAHDDSVAEEPRDEVDTSDPKAATVERVDSTSPLPIDCASDAVIEVLALLLPPPPPPPPSPPPLPPPVTRLRRLLTERAGGEDCTVTGVPSAPV
jgi:hypothetical protein